MSNVFVFRRPPHGVITEYFGGGKGGSTTTTNNVTQIPPEVLARYNAVNARAETVAQAPYQAYSQDPNAFVAPLSQTQQAGIQNTNAMAGAAQPYYGAATGLAAQSTGSVNPSALNVGQYMNPYTQSVVNATQAAMNQQQGQQLSQQQAEAIKGGAFGGERAGLQRAQLMGQQGLAQAQAIAPLYQQNYNQALAAAQQQQGVGLGAEQANRQNLQNAATLFGSIGTNAQQAGLAGAQAQLQAGQQQQQTQQAGLQALYNQFQQQQGFPYQQAQFLANIATGTGALSGNASSGTSTTTGGGGFFSDERLKENIKKVGETNDGQPIYRYNYKGDQRTQIGLLAQDVEKDHPEAVGSSQGYKTVDYKKATQDAVRKQGGGGLMPQMLTPEIEAGDASPEFEAGDVTPENMDAAYGTSTPNSTSGWGPRQDAAIALRGSWRDLPASRLTNTPDDRNSSGSEAMWRAPGARYGRATGGEAGLNPTGVDTYRIDAPSAMLRQNSGKGLGAMPSLPQAFMGGRDIPIEAGASGAGLAALRAPQATGYSLGTREGKQAELDSLLSAQNQPPGPNGALLGSGPQYLQSRIGTLQDWLNKNQSQGGLVSGPGNFARGGLADGGYMNPALAYYSPQQAQQGVFQLQPMPQRQILQGTPMQAPQQRQQPDEVTSALNIEKLVRAGNEMRPDFLRSAADVAARQRTADALAAREQQYIDWAKEKGYPLPSDAKAADKTGGGGDDLLEGGDEFARGGYAGRGYVNPYGGLGGNDILGPIIEEQDTSRRLSNDKVTPPPAPKQQSGGLGELAQMANTGKSLYKGGEWAAGKLGLGASPTAMSATSAEALPGVIDLTSGAGLAGAGETAAGLAGAGEAAAGLAGAEGLAAGAGLAELGTGAAAAGAGIMEALPFLAFLSDERAKHDIKKVGTLFDGQPVYRYAYNGDDKTQMGLLAQKVEKAAPEAVGLAGGMKTVDYRRATNKAAKRGHYQDGSLVVPEDTAEGGTEIAAQGGDGGETKVPRAGLGAPLARPAPRVPGPEDAVVATTPRAREPGVAPASRPPAPSKSFFPEITSEGVRDTLSSENFWVPAIAGIGSMLASPNKTLAGAIGSGLVGGTGAYTELQKQNADQLMKRLQFNKERFKGPVLIDGQERYQDTVHGDYVDEPTMQGRLAAFSGQKKLGPAPGAPAPADAAIATAREELGAPKPKLETTVKPPATTPPAAIQEAGAPAATVEAPKPPATAQAATATAQPAGEKPVDDIMAPPPSKLQLMNQARKDAALFVDIPENRRPDYLEREGKRLQVEANDYQRQADQFAADAKKLAKNPTAQAQYLSEATRLSSLATARRTEADQKNQAANAALESAIGPALANSDAIAKAQAELKFAGPKAAQALKDEIAKLKATQPLTLEAKEAEYSFTEGYKRQQLALTDAAKEAKEAQSLINQSNAILRASFDEKGKPTYSGGPLGSRLTNLSALMVQAGFSPSFVKDFTGTDPRNAQAARKLQTDAASEMARIALNGSPVRVTEFNQYLATTPGEDLLPEAMKWIVNNVIKPKAESLVGAYEKVKKLDPGKNNIEAELFDYRRDNPWFNPVKISENEAAQTAAPATPAVRQLTPEEQQRRDAEVLKRRAAQGAR